MTNSTSERPVYGYTTVPSTSRTVAFIAATPGEGQAPVSIVGKLVYFDVRVDNALYRSIGTVTNMTTYNTGLNSTYEGVIAERSASEGAVPLFSSDLRKSEVAIQAVFRGGTKGWEQYNSVLPTSPDSNRPVHIVSEETIDEMLRNSAYPSVGFFRGLSAPVPFNVPNYDRSGWHSAVLGRSGSGKTQYYGMMLGAYMRHENHAVMIIDPQGQWGNENGMIFSPQNFAKSLGRKVTVLKVARDIQLPMEQETLSRMIDKMEPWKRLFRMGKENQENLSFEVAQRISELPASKLNQDTKVMLEGIFRALANSDGALSRIYSNKEYKERLRHRLMDMIGDPWENEDGETPIPDQGDIDRTWASFLNVFQPLHNLFTDHNLSEGKRHPLDGDQGFLTEFFQVRESTPAAPAPYVVLDMSPDVDLHAKADVSNDASLGMQQLLDNDDIKALILQMVLRQMKKASEVAFASGRGLLNTQVVFDEAWRYAPDGKATPEIEELAKMLEGFALDTRKFGIGWTYILQSPSDLKRGIWRQLTYVHAGYGLIGGDVTALEALSDDPKQIDLYRQFISPASTGQYPFMVIGPISPLIFTTAPTFLNVFNGNEEFLQHNAGWIREITRRRSLPSVTVESLARSVLKPIAKAQAESQTHKVGRTYSVSEPQVAPKPLPNANEGGNLMAEVKRPIAAGEIVGGDEPLGEAPF